MTTYLLPTKEFERRVSVVLKTVKELSRLKSGSENELHLNELGMTPSEALAFYEQVIEALDTELEEMMNAWQEPEGLASEAKSKTTKPNGLG